jgi:hypothetical protein
MSLMTKQRKQGADEGPRRSGKPLNLWIPVALRDALDAQLARSRRPLTTEVIIALEQYLTTQGLWPPPESAEE